MNKLETNAYIKAVEAQIRAVDTALSEIESKGNLNDPAYAALQKVRIDLIELSKKFDGAN